jgi:hypothetical protein
MERQIDSRGTPLRRRRNAAQLAPTATAAPHFCSRREGDLLGSMSTLDPNRSRIRYLAATVGRGLVRRRREYFVTVCRFDASLSGLPVLDDDGSVRDRVTLIGIMGRQTAVALSEEDEEAFLAFLRADADIRIYRRAASSPELLVVPVFPPRGPGEWVYHLWNTAFTWEPECAEWQLDVVQDPGLASEFHLKNTAGAPLIEYMRQAFDNPKPHVYGRIYWNTDFAVYGGPAYDAAVFGRWYDHVVRWLRRNGNRVELAKNWYQYWLPGAWAQRCVESR